MQQLIFIMGSIASGADVIAEILRRLGVEMTGPDGRSTCWHAEDLRLAEIVLESIDPPRPGLDERHWFGHRHDDAVITAVLRDYLRERIADSGNLVGCYNELLLGLADQVGGIAVDNAAVTLHVVREPATHAAALRRRMPWLSDAQVNLLIDWSQSQTPRGNNFVVYFDRVVQNPASALSQLADAIGLQHAPPDELLDDRLIDEISAMRGDAQPILTNPSHPRTGACGVGRGLSCNSGACHD